MGWTQDLRRSAVAWALALVLGLVVHLPGTADAASATSAASPEREIVDLGTLPGAQSSQGTGINDRGWVVGWSDLGDMTSHAFLWRDGQMTDLGTLLGPSGSSQANDINNRGEVVGFSTAAPDGVHAVLWRHGQVIDLGTLGGSFAVANSINDRGVVVGYSSTPTEEIHAFRWRDGQMTDLGTVEGQSFSGAEAINNRGQIVGASGGPVVWRGGIPTRLQLVPGAEFGSALDNNNRGDIVGYSGFPSGQSINRAVIWRRGIPTDLGLEAGSSQATGVNDRDQVVGWRELVPLDGTEAFLWERGRVTTLESLTGAGGGAAAINNRGEIVGSSPVPGDPFSLGHAVVWR